ncbi:MAG: glycosyltransferase family 2 protein [Cytophagaceae bacterium]
MLPKISIITPSYNQAQFIERTILSVLNQNYPNLEYIIIDGGSTDGSVDIIKKYADRLTYWISEKDKGTFDANNKALAKITGDYWCVLNSDDVLIDGALKRISEVVSEKPNQKWIVGGVKYINETDDITGEEIPVKPESIAGYTFLHGCWISHPTVFLHKSLIDEIGVFHKYHLMDMNYWLRMENKGYQPYILNEYIACLRDHQDCKSSDRVKLQEEYIKVFDDFISEYNLLGDKAIQSKRKFNFLFFYKMRIAYSLVKRERLIALKLLIRLIKIQPLIIVSKWYLGAIKRLVFGVSANDPLRIQFPDVIKKGNWN